MKRREFITLLGSATVWPLAARAQQSAMPVIGSSTAPRQSHLHISRAALRQGLSEVGFVEGHNVSTEYRWAEGNRYERLSELAG